MKNRKKYLVFGIVIIIIVVAILFLQKGTPTMSKQVQNFSTNQDKEGKYPRAIEINGGTGYINTNKSLTISSLMGKKVVLVDFWTYTCINCIRTIPYLNSWYQKYKDQGLEIIGIHTPEFSFEKDYDNVVNAVNKLGIKYPVVLDSDRNIWNAYNNQFWPTKYLIDIDGYIVETHFGEGNYDETEKNIQRLLKERAKKLNLDLSLDKNMSNPSNTIYVNYQSVLSPETYFGAERNSYLSNGIVGVSGVQNLSLPRELDYNKLYLVGLWNISSEYASPLKQDASIVYGYNAKNVYIVASSEKERQIRVILDSKNSKFVKIGPYDLYPIISGENYGIHALEITNLSKDMQFYTFTFG